MIGMKSKNGIEVNVVNADKSETYPEEEVLSSDSLYRYLYQSGEEHGYHLSGQVSGINGTEFL